RKKEPAMSYAYEMDRPLAARAAQSERAAFIRRTYLHLAGAVLAFVILEVIIFNMFSARQLDTAFLRSPWAMLVVLLAFIGVGALARWWAYNGTSQAMAYIGLAVYVVLEAIIFVPILHIAIHYVPDPYILPQAAVLTLCVFGGLTAGALVTKQDFS